MLFVIRIMQIFIVIVHGYRNFTPLYRRKMKSIVLHDYENAKWFQYVRSKFMRGEVCRTLFSLDTIET